MDSVLPEKVLTRLEESAKTLSELCNLIDDGELNVQIDKVFSETRLDLAASVSRRLCFFDMCRERLETYKRIQREIQAATKRLEMIRDKVEDKTKAIMEAYPDIPYKCDLGVMRVQKNSQPKLEFRNGLIPEGVSLSNTVEAREILKHQIDERYFQARTHYILLVDKIKEALQTGRDIQWATLSTGSHLRIQR